jgi:hypothetical protein
MLGGIVLKSWSKQQRVIALSSGEAELYAAVKLGSEMIGIHSLASEMGLENDMNMHIDAKATIGMIARKGAGSLRHVEVNTFWLQAVVRSGRIRVKKIAGEINPADILTKYVDGQKSAAAMYNMGYETVDRVIMHR